MQSEMPETFSLLADVGGTNARFALFGKEKKIQNIVSLPTIDYPNLIDAINYYLEQNGSPQVTEGAIAMACPIIGDRVKMTNHHWAFSIAETKSQLGFDRLLFLNDFTALAMALPHLPQHELHQFGGKTSIPGLPIALIGPGTGLGVSGLFPDGNGKWIPIAGEGGHVTACATNGREEAIINMCRRDYDHISAERLISGMGLTNLYMAIAKLAGARPQSLNPSEVTRQGLAGTNSFCVEALDVFCGLLGSVAGNLVLTLGARGGLYIGGGIVPKLGSYFYSSSFRNRFESKGRYVAYLSPIPAYVITSQDPALVGVTAALGYSLNSNIA